MTVGDAHPGRNGPFCRSVTDEPFTSWSSSLTKEVRDSSGNRGRSERIVVSNNPMSASIIPPTWRKRREPCPAWRNQQDNSPTLLGALTTARNVLHSGGLWTPQKWHQSKTLCAAVQIRYGSTERQIPWRAFLFFKYTSILSKESSYDI